MPRSTIRPSSADDDEGDRDGDEGVAAELADDRGGVGADHDELAVRHVDDAGDAEDDGEPDRGDDENGGDAEADQELGDERLRHGRVALRRQARVGCSAIWSARRPIAAARSLRTRGPSCRIGSCPRDHGFFSRSSTVRIGEVAVLVGIEIVDPRVGTDAVLRRPDDVELAVLAGLADARPQMGVVVLLVDLDRTLRRLELLAGQAVEDQRVGLGRARPSRSPAPGDRSGSTPPPSPRWSPGPCRTWPCSARRTTCSRACPRSGSS